MAYFLEIFEGTNEKAQRDLACRFPARVFFLRRELGLRALPSETETCRNLREYRRRAPADSISLIFAAENISHPMSMLGHVFLRLEGKSKGATRDHAASFYTTITSANPIGVLLDSFLLGMQSRFVLLPYQEQISLYLEQQGRNVWEYQLKLTRDQITLIHLHIWELRDINSDYLFVGYNCATVVYLILSLAAPELTAKLPGWIAPIDVVRAAYSQNLVDARALRPSIDWLLRALEAEIGSARSKELVELLRRESPNTTLANLNLSPLELAFFDALSERARTQPDVFGHRTPIVLKGIAAHTTSPKSRAITAENIKDPVQNPPLSRLAIGHTWIDGGSNVRLEYRPASHSLVDQYRNGMTESGLELGATSIRLPAFNKRPRIESLKVYSFESIVPWSTLVGGNSSRVSIGLEEHRDRELLTYSAAAIGGGFGRAYQLSSDLLTFGFVDAAAGYGDGRAYATYSTELGAIFYEVFNMKMLARYQLRCGEHKSTSCYNRAIIEQSLAVSNKIAPYGRLDEIWDRKSRETRVEVGLRLFF